MQAFIDAVLESFASQYETLIGYLPRVVVALTIMVVTLIGARWFGDWANRGLRRVQGLPASAVALLSSVARTGVIIIGVLAVLQVLNLGQVVASTIASLGIVGLVLGFALQDITKNFASGMILLLTRPFDIGDMIKVGAHEGQVVDLRLRVTVLKTTGGDEVLIPNADVYTSTLYNMSRYAERRLAVPFTVPLAENFPTVREQILAEISTVPGIVRDPPPSIVATSAADQKISAELRYWVPRNTPNQDELTTRVIALVSKVLKEE